MRNIKQIAGLLIALLSGVGCVAVHPVSWKTLPELRVGYDQAWAAVLDVITDRNIQLEVVDKEAGYIKSERVVDGQSAYIVAVKFVSQDPVKIKLQVSGVVFDPLTKRWQRTGFPSAEKELLDEIDARLRTRTPPRPSIQAHRPAPAPAPAPVAERTVLEPQGPISDLFR